MAHEKLSSQIGASGVPLHRATQVPMFMSSTSQHIAPAWQSSMPLTPLPSAMHTSPGTFIPVTGTHLVAFQAPPPPSAQAVHFSPGAQSCLKTSHSFAEPTSGGQPA
jgi:hypothetical protein